MADGNPKYLDPISIKLTGLSAEQAKKEGYIIKPMTIEESYDLNKHMVPDMPLSQYQDLYRQTYSDEATISRDDYLTGYAKERRELLSQVQVITPKKSVLIRPEILGYKDPNVELFRTNFSKGRIGEMYNHQGKLEYTMTAEEAAESKGYYIDPRMLMQTPQSMSEYYKADIHGTPFKYDENGKKRMLVIDPVRREWVEVDGDAIVAGRQQRSIHGPQAAESSIGENIMVNVGNTLIDETIGAAGTVAEIAGQAYKWVTGDTPEALWKWARETQNFAGGIRSKVSEAVEQEGAFGSWRAGLGTAANAITQVGSQALIGLLTRGVATPLTMLTKARKLTQLFRAGAKHITQAQVATSTAKAANGFQRALNGAPWLFGAAYAMQAMNEEAKSIGLGQDARMAMSISAGLAVLFSERVLHSIGARGLVDMFDDGTVKGAAAAIIRKEFSEAGKAAITASGKLKPTYQTTVKNAVMRGYRRNKIDPTAPVTRNKMASLLTSARNWMRYSDKPGSLIGRGKGMVSGAIEEGSEEIIEAIWNGVSKTIYNEGFADPNAKPGHGMFEKPFHEISLSTFAAGAIGGGFMGVLRGASRKPKLNGRATAVALTNLGLDGTLDLGVELHKKAEFGSPFHTADGQLIETLPADKQEGALSMNDIGFIQFREEVRAAHQMMMHTGLTDPEKLSRALGDDKGLIADVLTKLIDTKQLQQEQADIKAALEEMTDKTSTEYKESVKRIDEIQGLIDENNNFTQQVLDGTAQEKYSALMAMRGLDLQREAFKGMTQEEYNKLSEEERDAILLEKIEEARGTDSWTNRDKAISRVKKIQQKNAEYKAARDSIQRVRNNGKTLGRLLYEDENLVYPDPLDSADAKLSFFENEFSTMESDPEIRDDERKLSRSKFGGNVKTINDEINKAEQKNVDDALEVAEDAINKRIDEVEKEIQDEVAAQLKEEVNKLEKGRGKTPALRSAQEEAVLKAKGDKIEAKARQIVTNGLSAEEFVRQSVNQQMNDFANAFFEEGDDLSEFNATTKAAFKNSELGKALGGKFDEFFNNLEKIKKYKQRLSVIEANIDDDVEKNVIDKSGLDAEGRPTFFAAVQELDDNRFQPTKMYIAEDKDGKKTTTTKETYEEAKSKGKKISDTSYEYNGQIYSEENTPVDSATGVGTVDLNFGKITLTGAASVKVSAEGARWVKGSPYQRQIYGLMQKLEMANNMPTSEMYNEGVAIKNEIEDDIEALNDLMILNNKGFLTERTKEWLGIVEGVPNFFNDIQGMRVDAISALHVIENILNAMNSNMDLRDKNFKELAEVNVKWNAQIVNELADNFDTTMDITVDGTTIEPIVFDDVDGLTMADEPRVVEAMQYWHYYFKQIKGEELIPRLKKFWHETVNGYRVDTDADNNFIFTKEAKADTTVLNESSPKSDGIHLNDFDDLKDFSNFALGSKNNKHRRLVYYDTLNMLLNANPLDVYNGFFETLDAVDQDLETAKYRGAHTSEQILVTLPLITHIIENSRVNALTEEANNGDADAASELRKYRAFKTVLKGGATNEMNLGVFKWTVDSKTGKKVTDLSSAILDNWRLVTGSGGSGKTSFITMTALRYALDNNYFSKEDVLIVAPNKHQLNEMKKSLLKVGFTEDEVQVALVDEFIDNNVKDEYEGKLIIIDEISMMTKVHKASTYMANYTKYNDQRKGNGLHESNTVIIMGDEMQSPMNALEDVKEKKPTEFIQHGFNITQVKRTNIESLFLMQALFRGAGANFLTASYPKLLNETQYYEGDDEYLGVRLFNDEAEFFKKVASRPDAKLIVYGKEDMQEAISNGVKEENIFVMTDLDKSPQGQTIKEVYVYMPITGSMTTDTEHALVNTQYGEKHEMVYFNRYMGTAAGRASHYLGMYTGDNKVQNNGSKPVKKEDITTYSDSEEKVKEDKKALYERFDAISKVERLDDNGKTKKKVSNIVNNTPNNTSKRKTGTTSKGKKTPTNADKFNSNYKKGNRKKVNGKFYTITDIIPTGNDTWTVEGTRKGKKYAWTVSFNGTTMVNSDPVDITKSTKSTKGTDNKGKGQPKVVITPIKNEDDDPEDDTSNVDEPETSYDNNDGGSGGVDPENVSDDTEEEETKTDNVEGIILREGGIYQVTNALGNIRYVRIEEIEDDTVTYEIGTLKNRKFVPKKGGRKKQSKKGFINSLQNTSIETFDNSVLDITNLLQNNVLSFFGSNLTEDQRNEMVANASLMKDQDSVTVQITIKKNQQSKLTKTAYTYEVAFLHKGEYRVVNRVHLGELVGDQTDSNDYFTELRRIALKYDGKITDSGFILYEANGIDPKDISGSVVKTSISTDPKTHMSFDALESMIEQAGGKVVSVKQGKNKNGRTVSVVEFTLGDSDVVNTVHMDSVNMISSEESKAAIRALLDSFLTKIEKSGQKTFLRSKGKPSPFTDEFNKDFFNHIQNQLSRDVANKNVYALDLLNKGIIKETGKTLDDGTVLYNINFESTSVKSIKEAYTNFINAIKTALDENTGLNLRMPTAIEPKTGEIINTKVLRTQGPVEIGLPKVRVKLDNNTIDGVGLNKSKSNEKNNQLLYNMTKEEAMQELRETLGPLFPYVFAEGLDVHGRVTKLGKILLNLQDNKVADRTVFHEVAHFVAEFLISREERNQLYDEIGRRKGINDWLDNAKSRRAVAEEWAEMGERFRSERRNLRGISKFLRNMMDRLMLFFDNIGLIKNITHRYLYDIYVNKKYASDDFMPLYESLEEIYEEGLDMSKDTPFENVVNYYGSTVEASRSTWAVSEIMSAPITLPVMSSRFFKQDSFSERDLLNRVEYAIRSRVMFETDNTGNVKLDQKDGFPILRKDDMGRYLRVKNKKGKRVDLFKYDNNYKDSKGNYLGKTLMYFDESSQSYRVAPRTPGGIYFLDSKSRNKIRKSLRKAAANFLLSTGVDEEGDQTFAGMYGDGISINEIQDSEKKKVARLAGALDDEVFLAMVSRTLDNLPVREIYYGADKTSRSFKIAATRAVTQGDTVARKENNQVSPIQRMSAWVKYITSTTPRYDYNRKDKKWVKTNEFLDQHIVEKIMNKLPMISTNPRAGSTIEQHRAHIKNRIREIESGDTNFDHEELSYLNSIYYNFYADETNEAPSHFAILQMHNDVLNGYGNYAYKNVYLKFVEAQKKEGLIAKHEPPLKQNEFEAYILNRAKQAYDVLNSIAMHYGSISKDANLKAKVFGAGSSANTYVFEMKDSTVEAEQRKIQDNLLSAVLESDGVTVAPSFVSLFGFDGDPKSPINEAYEPTTILQTDGVYLNVYNKNSSNMTKIKVIDFDTNTGRISSVDINAVRNNIQKTGQTFSFEIKKLLNETFKYNMNANYVEKMLRPAKIRQGLAEKADINWDDFATIVAPVLLSAYTFTAPQYFGEDIDAKENKKYKTKAEAFQAILEANLQGRYGKISNDKLSTYFEEKGTDEVSEFSDDGGQEGGFYFPTEMFVSTEKLAQLQIAASGQYNRSSVLDVRGKRIYLETVQDLAGYRFADQGSALSADFAKDMREGAIPNNVNHLNGDILLNPYLANGFVEQYAFVNGFQNAFGGGRVAKNLTVKEQFDLSHDLFVKDFSKSQRSWPGTHSYVMSSNHGDRTRLPVWKLNWIKNSSLVKGFSNGLLVKSGDNINLDADNIFHHVMNAYKIAIKAQVRSLNKWVDFINSTSQGIGIDEQFKITDAELVSDSVNYNNVYERIKELRSAVKTILKQADYFTDVDGSVPNTDVPFRLSGNKQQLKLGEDFIIMREYDDDGNMIEGGKVILGWAGELYGNISHRSTNGTYTQVKSPFNWLSATNESFNRTYVNEDTGDSFDMSLAEMAMNTNQLGKTLMKDGETLDTAEKENRIYNLFKKDLRVSNARAKEAGYRLYKKDMYGAQANMKEDYIEGFSVPQAGYYTPWVANNIASQLQNIFHAFAFEGGIANHTDYDFDATGEMQSANHTVNANKRLNQHSSNIQKVPHGGYYDIDPETVTLHIEEAKMSAYNFTSNNDSNVATPDHSPFDGEGIISPMFAMMLYMSGGRSRGSIAATGNLKTQSPQDNGNFYKHALSRPTGQSMMWMPEQRQIFEIMHNPTAKPYLNFGQIKNENQLDTEFQAYDSLFQRYALYEMESKFVDALDEMIDFIDGDVEGFLKDAGVKPKKAEQLAKNYSKAVENNDLINEQYAKLAEIYVLAEQQDAIVEPKRIANFDYALNKLVDFYARKRRELNAQGINHQEVYPYISHIETPATTKQKAQILGAPVTFRYGGSSTPMIVNGQKVYQDNSKNLEGRGVPLYNLQLQDGSVPVDLFSAFGMYRRQQPGELDLGGFYQTRNNLLEGQQLDANRKYDDSLEAPMTQMMTLLMSSPDLHKSGKAREMMDIFAEIMTEAMDSFEKQIADYAVKEEYERMDPTYSIDTNYDKILHDFIKEKVKVSMAAHDSSSMLGVIVANENIHISVSMGSQERVHQYLNSYFRKNVVKRKVNAMRLVQASGMMAEVYEFTDVDGVVELHNMTTMRNYAITHLGMSEMDIILAENKDEGGKGIDVILQEAGYKVKKRGLKQTTIKLNPEIEITDENLKRKIAEYKNEYGQEYIFKLIEEGIAIVEPGEMLAPAAKFDKYNIPKDIDFNELYRLSNNIEGQRSVTRLYDLATAENRSALKEVIENFVDEHVGFEVKKVGKKTKVLVKYTNDLKRGDNRYFDTMFHDALNGWLRNNRNKVKDIENAVIAEYEEATGSSYDNLIEVAPEATTAAINNLISNKIKEALIESDNDSTTVDDKVSLPNIVDKYVDALIAVRLTTEMTASTRTPSGPGSTFVARVIGFINDNGSTAYVNTIKNEIDGSDMDIDQFTTYFKSDTMQQLGYTPEEEATRAENWDTARKSKEKIDNLNNRMLDILFDYYMNPDSTDITQSPISLRALQKAARGAEERMFPEGDLAYNLGQSFKMHNMSHDGKQAVGGSALSQKGQNRLMAAVQQLGESVLNGNAMPWGSIEEYRYVPKRVEALSNGATDNPKLMILGLINVNAGNISLVAHSLFAPKLILDHIENNRETFGFSADEDISIEDAIYAFFKGDEHTEIFEYIKRNTDFKEGKYAPSVYKAAHSYYTSLSINRTENIKKLVEFDQEKLGLLDQIDEALEVILGDDKVELFGPGNITIDQLSDVKKIASRRAKKKYAALSRMLRRRAIGSLKFVSDLDMRESLEQELNDIRKSFVEDNYEMLETINEIADINTKEELVEAFELSEEIKAAMSSLFKAMNKMDRLNKRTEVLAKKTKQSYMDAVLIIAKQAYFAEWMDNFTKIVNIDQFNNTSVYDRKRYIRNLEFMTGRNFDEFMTMYEEFKESGSDNAQHWLKENYFKTPDAKKEFSMNMFAHRMASGDFDHMREAVGNEELSVSYFDDLHQMADITAILFSLPNIMASIKATQRIGDYSNKLFVTEGLGYEAIRNEMRNDVGRDEWSERQYRTLDNELHKNVVGSFLKSNYTEDQFRQVMSDLGRADNIGNPLPLVSADGINGLIPGIRTQEQARVLMNQVPLYFENTIKPELAALLNTPEYKNNRNLRYLLEHLVYGQRGDNNYLYIQHPASKSALNIEQLRDGFASMPEKYQAIITFYQIAKDGFSYTSNAFLSQVVAEKYYELFSGFITKRMSDNNERKGKLVEEEMNYIKNMVVSNPKNNLMRSGIYNPDTKEYTPPLGADGFVNLYKKTVFKSYNKGRRRTVDVMARVMKTDHIHAVRSTTTGNENNVSVIKMFASEGTSFDLRDAVIPANALTTLQGTGVEEIDGDLTFGAYINYFIKGNIYGIIERYIKNNPDATEEEINEQKKTRYLTAEYMNNNYMGQYKYGSHYENNPEKAGGDFKERDAVSKAMRDKVYTTLATVLYNRYADNPAAFNQIVEDTKGKIIVDKNYYSVYDMAPQVQALFSNLIAKSKDGDYYSILLKETSFPENIPLAYEEQHIINRQSRSIGIPYRPVTRITSNDLIVHNAKGRTDLAAKLGWSEENIKEGYIPPNTIPGIILRASLANDSSVTASQILGFDLTDALSLSKVTALMENFEDTFDINRADIEGFLDNVVKYIYDNVAKWHEGSENLEKNLDHQKAINEIHKTGTSKRTYTLKRRAEFPYIIGDIITFPSGAKAVVTDVLNENKEVKYKLLGGGSIMNRARVWKAVTSLEDRVSSNNAKRAVESMVRVLKKSMPGVEYEFIDSEQQAKMGVENAVSFFHNGKVYINLDLADANTALHEFAHPYVIALKNERSDIYDAIAEVVLQDAEVMNYIEDKYPDLVDRDEIVMEAIPTYIQMRAYARDYYFQSREQKALWDEYFGWVKGTFTEAVKGPFNVNTTLELLDFKNATMQDFADAIINDLKRGEPIRYLSQSSEYRHAVPYVMRSATSSRVKNISINNIDQLFQTRANYDVLAEEREIIQDRIDDAILTGNEYYGLTGKYNFKPSNPIFRTNGKFDATKRLKKIKEITDLELQFTANMSENLVDFLNDIGDLKNSLVLSASKSILRGINKKKIQDDDEAFIKYENILNAMLIDINFNRESDVAMPFDQAMTVLGVNMPSNMMPSKKPVVIIHNKGQEDQYISIYQVTTKPFTESGVLGKQALGTAYMNRNELSRADRQRANSISLMNTNQDINALKNALLAMAISKAKPDTVIRRVGSLRFGGGEQSPYQKHFKDMEDMVQPIKDLFSISELKNNLERDMHELLSDENILNTDRYRTDYMEKLGRYLRSSLARMSKEDRKKATKLHEALEIYEHVQGDHLQTRSAELAKAIKARLVYLRNQVLRNDKELIASSTEYQDLAYTYLQLTGYNEVGTKKVTPISFDEMWIDTADRWHGQVRTWVFDSLDKNLRQSKEKLMPFQETINAKSKVLYTLNPHLKGGKDTSHKLFAPLFKKTEVYDENGNLTEISLHEIHHDRNDEETAKLLASGELTEEMFEFGEWLANEMYEEFVNYVIDIERSSLVQDVNDSEETIRARAELSVAKRYKKGMMPVFTRSAASALSEGNLKQAFEIFAKGATRWYGGNLYEEYAQSTDDKMQRGAFRKLLSPFWNQFKKANKYGGRDRLYLLGLDMDENGKLIVYDKKKQANLSYNLQDVGLYTKGASLRARHLKEAVANVNIALDILRGEQQLKGVRTKEIISQLENYVNRQVYGNMPEVAKLQLSGMTINLDNFLDVSGKLIHMIHLAVNPVLGAKNMASQAMKMFTNSLVNAMVGNNQFTTAEVTRAAQEVVTNSKKVQALNRKYQIVNITERDLLNHFINNTSKANAFQTELQMVFHWFGDHYTQLIGAMAQMMQDGTYDAHDNEGNYDMSKDKRFQQQDGDIIKEAIMKQQYKEQYHIPMEDGTMTHAYSQRQENRIKVIVQRYVSELNDNQYKNMISSIGLARAVMSLKTYMFNVKQNWYKERRPEVQLGGFEVVGEGDKKDAAWVSPEVEGVLQTIAYITKKMATLEKVEMDPMRWRNVGYLGATTVVIAGVYLLVDLLTEGFDDDEDKRKKNPDKVFYGASLMKRLYGTGYVVRKDSKDLSYVQQMLRYIIAGAANEQLSYSNPFQIITEWKRSPNPYIWQMKNTWNAFTGLLTLPKDIYDEGLATSLDSFFYGASKTIPFGSSYRIGRNAFVEIRDDIMQSALDKDILESNFKK